VIWFCDLRGFTQLGDSMPPGELVALLDRYFECVAGPIEDAGGEILKFVGDAVLAVFPCEEAPGAVAERALAGARAALAALADFSALQKLEQKPELHMGVSLHVGEVFYGNIGGRARLDFTVIGAAVNEAARVESLCKEFGVPLLTTRRFSEAVGRQNLVSVGSRQLRGVREVEELFTLEELLPRA
jgi:adenylate cyclase